MYCNEYHVHNSRNVKVVDNDCKNVNDIDLDLFFSNGTYIDIMDNLILPGPPPYHKEIFSGCLNLVKVVP
ncbi:hypothetical protein PIROE2DRAFT_13265 [Piromyces sp. E2]|nr:hypothetical protein PIROE2DRAFT_13265 [Piromyces sp. E2]|eukprot:OUM60892.1 hypothetical protein PIROE2DRAFT_13265 [Piromyces sp. E2]